MNKNHSVEKKEVSNAHTKLSYNCSHNNDVIDHIRHTAEIIYEKNNGTNFGWKYLERIPNTKEIFNTVTITSLIDVLASPLFKSLGTHPSAKNILRDIAKIPSVMMNAMEKTPIGRTSYVNDEFNTGAAVAKVVCKATFIFGLPTVIPQAIFLPTDIIARVSNGICEIPSSAILLAGRERQDNNKKDIPALSYFIYNLKADWFLNGILNTIGKVSITDSIGTIAHSLFTAKFNFEGVEYKLKGMSDVFRYWLFKIPGINHVYTSLFESKDVVLDVMAKTSKVVIGDVDKTIKEHVASFPSMYQVIQHEHAKSIFGKAKLYVSAFLQDYILKAFSEVGITLILAAPARVVVDSITEIYDVWYNNNKHIELLTKKGIYVCSIEMDHGRHHQQNSSSTEQLAIEQEHGRHHQQDSSSTEQLAGEQVKVNDDL